MRLLLTLFSVSLFLLQTGCNSGDGYQSIPVQNLPVKTLEIHQEKWVSPIRASGLLASSEQSRLSFKIGGIIDRFDVKEGDVVKTGQALASLKLDEIEAQVIQASNGFEKAQRDFRRAQNLYADSVATLEQMQDAKTGLAVAEALLKIAEFNFKHAQIVAPESGTILKQLAERNELVAPGYPVFLFASGKKDWVLKAGVTDKDVVKITVGDSAVIRFDAYPNIDFPAAIREIAGAPDPMSGTFEVVLALFPMNQTLFTGFIGSALIYPARRDPAYRIPMGSLVDANQGSGIVFTVRNNCAVRHLVRILEMTDNDVVIDGNLEDTELLVTEGASYLKDGMSVDVQD